MAMRQQNDDFLNALHLKRSALSTQLEPLQVQYERIAQQKADLDSRISAIDTVIKEFASSTAQTQETARETQTPLYPQNGNGTADASAQDGLKKYARANFHLLPNQYTKREVLKMLQPARPGAKINPNTLSGVMRNLVDGNLAKVKTAAIGRSPQVYEKV